MKHKGCGGEVSEDWSKLYEYYGERASESHPALRCRKCGVEITGDPMLEFEEGESNEQSKSD